MVERPSNVRIQVKTLAEVMMMKRGPQPVAVAFRVFHRFLTVTFL